MTKENFNKLSFNTRRKIINFIIRVGFIEYKIFYKEEVIKDFNDNFYVGLIMCAMLPGFYLLFFVSAKTYYRKKIIANYCDNNKLLDIIKTMFVAKKINSKMERELLPYLFTQEE